MTTPATTTTPPSRLVAAGRAVDLGLRVLYCALAPFLLTVLRMLLPIEGLVISIAIATVIALLGSARWQARVERIRYVGRVLGGFGRVGAFYDEHPPKPLVYYVAFPLLLPIVVFRKVARRELGVMRRFNAIAVTAIVATAGWEYLRHWWPQLGFGHFVAATFVVMLFQMIVTMMVISPIVTTLVIARQRGHRRLLAVTVALMAASTVLGVAASNPRHAHPFMVQTRVEQRSLLGEAPGVRVDALRAAGDAEAAGGDRAAQLAAAHAALEKLYLPDEADTFELAEFGGTTVLYARFGHRVIWSGLAAGKVVTAPGALPQPLRAVLGVE